MRMARRKRLVYELSIRYVLLVIISFVPVFASFYGIMSQTIVSERTNVLEQRLSIITDGLNNRLNTVMALQSDLIHDEGLQTAIKSPGTSVSLSMQLNRYRANSYLFNALYLFDHKLNTLAISQPTTSNGGIQSDLQRAVREFAQTYAFRRFVMTQNGKIYFLFALYPPEDYNYYAYGAAEINKERLFFEFSQNMMDVFSAACVKDGGEDWHIFKIDPDSIFEQDDFGIEDGSSLDVRYTTLEHPSSAYSPWKITAVYDQSKLQAASRIHLRVLWGIFLLAVLVAVIVSVLLARGIVLPIRQVLQSMEQLEQGYYPSALPIRRDDEIGQLVKGYNHAVAQLADLNQKILAEQQKKREYEVLSIKTQLDLLQNQINPHFIHNTLNTLKYMAIKEGNIELSKVITSFNALLRASINVTSDFNTVTEEIEYVEQYIHIQRHRFVDKQIKCFFNVDDSSRQALLPRLILQPLVENSLFHGLLPNNDRPGEIHVICLTQNSTPKCGCRS